MSKALREQRADIDAQLKASQTSSAKKFKTLLKRKAIQDAVKEVGDMRDTMVPGSPEEQQLDAYLNVHTAILTYLEQTYPDEVAGETIAAPTA